MISSIGIPGDLILSACADNTGKWAIAVGLGSAYCIDFDAGSYAEILDGAEWPVCFFGDGKHAAVSHESNGRFRAALVTLNGSLNPDIEYYPEDGIQIVRNSSNSDVLALQTFTSEENGEDIRPVILTADLSLKPTPAQSQMFYEVRDDLELSPDGSIAGKVMFNGSAHFFSLETGKTWRFATIDSSPNLTVVLIGGCILTVGIACVYLVLRNRKRALVDHADSRLAN